MFWEQGTVHIKYICMDGEWRYNNIDLNLCDIARIAHVLYDAGASIENYVITR